MSTTRIMQLQCWLAVSLDECQQEELSHKQTDDDLREAATAEEAQEADESDLLEELVDLPEAVLGFVVVICQHGQSVRKVSSIDQRLSHTVCAYKGARTAMGQSQS